MSNPSPYRVEDFHVPALDCSEELALIERGLGKIAGVRSLSADYLERTLRVEFDPDLLDPDQIAAAIGQLGFQASPVPPQTAPQPPARVHWSTASGGLLLLASFAAGLLTEVESPPSAVLAILSAACSGLLVAKAAVRAVRLWAIDMNVLMTLAVFGALVTRNFQEAATAMFLFSFSLWLEARSMDRARRAVHSLLRLTPQTAHRVVSAAAPAAAVADPRTSSESSPADSDSSITSDSSTGVESSFAAANEAMRLETVRADSLAVGDVVLVKPGEHVPVDGHVLVGDSSVDQSPITGESLPVDKGAGDSVYAGSLNGEGSLQIAATRPPDDSTLAHIARLVRQAQASRSPTERFVDRFARKYTPAVIALALLVALLPPLLTAYAGVSWPGDPTPGDWFYRGLVLLVIACPCALVISTPITIVCGLHAAARRGMLIKGGEHLENAGRVTALALDKTGTLTTGQPAVIAIRAVAPHTEDEILSLAAALESHSEHPLGVAIVREARRRELPAPEVADFVSLRGLGVEGTVAGRRIFCGSPRRHAGVKPSSDNPTDDRPGRHKRNDQARQQDEFNQLERNENEPTAPPDTAGAQSATAVHIVSEGRTAGVLYLADTLRSDAQRAIAELAELGVRHLAILTGDRLQVARSVANQLALPGVRIEVFGDLLPEDKVTQVGRLARLHPFLAVVGDGVNDAPALAAARLGIAFGSAASDTALDTADVAVTAPELRRLPQLIAIGRRCRRLLAQNIALALSTKAVVLALAAAGWATMWMAVAADVGASLLVIANGMRILSEAPSDELRHDASRRLRNPSSETVQ